MLRGSVDKALRDTILGHSLREMDTYFLKPSDEDLTGGKKEYTEWLEVYPNVAYLRRGKTRKRAPDVIARRLG